MHAPGGGTASTDSQNTAERLQGTRHEIARLIKLRDDVGGALLGVSAAARRDAERLLPAAPAGDTKTGAGKSSTKGRSVIPLAGSFTLGLACGLAVVLLMRPPSTGRPLPIADSSTAHLTPSSLTSPAAHPSTPAATTVRSPEAASHAVATGLGYSTKTPGDVTTAELIAPAAPAASRTPVPNLIEAAGPQHTVSILPFTRFSRTAGETELGTILADTVSQRITALESVELVQTSADAGWVVAGGVQQIGKSVRVTARVVDGRDGGVVNTVKIDGHLDDLPRMREDVASAIQKTLVETLGLQDSSGTKADPVDVVHAGVN